MQCVHADRDTVYSKSVCLSVRPSLCPMPVLWTDISSHFLTIPRGIILAFRTPLSLHNSEGKTLSGGDKYTRGGKIWQLSLYNEISWNTIIEIQPINRCRFQWPWVTLKGGTLQRVKIFRRISIITPKRFDPRVTRFAITWYVSIAIACTGINHVPVPGAEPSVSKF